MRYVVTFIVAVVCCFLIDVHGAYGEEWDRGGMMPTAMSLDLSDGTGLMIASWNGDYPLETYENKWLDFAMIDDDSGELVEFEMWFTVWVGVCAPPCEMKVEFIVQNVNFVTK